MPSEKSLEMSRPRSPTIAAAADPVSPALAESSGSATWTTERRPRERIELDAHSVEDDACMRGASRRRRLAFKAPASDDRQKRYARARPRPVHRHDLGSTTSAEGRSPTPPRLRNRLPRGVRRLAASVLLRAVGAGRLRRVRGCFAIIGAFWESLAPRFVAGELDEGRRRGSRQLPRRRSRRQCASELSTGTIGARRAWTVSMISVLSMPCR
jgi:hypothetical protein